jgi:hypothetical protein
VLGDARLLALSLALAMGPGSTAALAAEPVETSPASAESIMDFYPAPARAAKIEGDATLNCATTPSHGLTACRLLKEKPRGWGFGEAALALAQRAKDNAFVMSTTPTGPVTFVFRLHPPSILPNVLDPTRTYIPPDFLRIPSSDLMGYPATGAGFGGGRVILDCVVNLDFRLNPCEAVASTPANSDLKRFALGLARHFVLRPLTVDGKAQGGAHVVIPLAFGPRR